MALKNKQNNEKEVHGRTIVLPISEAEYGEFVKNNRKAHETIQLFYKQYPELFPLEMSLGYSLNGRDRVSKKMDIKLRKILINGVIYRIRPSFILPYFRGKTEEVSKPLFLIKFGVPFWVLAYVFGKNAMWWYRLYNCLSRYNIVGTTIKDSTQLPQDLLADEHHIYVGGKRAYVATTIGENCFLGMEATWGVDALSLEQAYGVFKQEAQSLKSDYQPDTVNTDGWFATQNAWKKLFPAICIIECFLHAFLKVRDRATKKIKAYFDVAATKIWECYRTESKRQLAQQIRRLKEWTMSTLTDSPMKKNILKLCQKKDRWLKHFDFPSAHKTSNMLDRLMRAMNRHAFNSQMFHASISSTSNNFRAFALLYNFAPSCPAAWSEDTILKSPAARLNGFIYHKDWLHNLLISASRFEVHKVYHQRNPL